jgi:predicted nucleic acid-binding protein
MRGPLTVDASVFLNALHSREDGHATSRMFVDRLRDEQIPLVLPTLLLVEVAATLGRSSGQVDIGRLYINRLLDLPHVVVVSLDRSLANDAAEIALYGGLKGSDAVYGATARRYAATLVTLDRQQLTRMPADVIVRSPAEIMAE